MDRPMSLIAPRAIPAPRASSPCTKVCILDAVTGLCEGCGRTRDEIALWGAMSEPQRRMVMAALPERLRSAYPNRPAPTP